MVSTIVFAVIIIAIFSGNLDTPPTGLQVMGSMLVLGTFVRTWVSTDCDAAAVRVINIFNQQQR